MLRTRIDVAGGQPEVVRTADAASARELEAIGARLHGAAHPGVVQVRRSAPTADGGWELRVAHGGGPLATLGPLAPPRLAAIGAGLATTLADLHDHGIVHGRLTPARVLVGDHDRTLLCGFGGAQPEAGPEDDVAGLASVLLEHLGPPVEGRAGAATGRALRGLLEQAADPVPSRRPAMRRLATTLADHARPVTPAIRRPEPSAGRRRGRGDRPLGTWPQLGAVGVAIVVLSVGAAQLRTGSPPPAAPASAPVAGVAVASSTTVPLVDRPAPGGSGCAQIEGSGSPAVSATCPHEVSIDGDQVTVDGERYQVGEPSDLVAVGSWRCSGDATIVLLRPSTGEVFAFPAPAGVERTVETLRVVPGAVGFHVVDRGPRCQELSVLDGQGAATPLDLGPR